MTTVLLGFARSYFVAGIFFAPLPSLLVHLHAAAMSCWILLFIAQAALIATGRVGLHRKLGVAGAVLAAFIAISGIAVVSACVRRGGVPPVFTKNFSLVNNVLGFLLFGILVGRAILVRRNSPAHKRLMLIATINLMIPAVARWPFLAPQQILPAIRLSLIIPLLLIVFFSISCQRAGFRSQPSAALGPMSALVAGTLIVQNLTTWLTRLQCGLPVLCRICTIRQRAESLTIAE